MSMNRDPYITFIGAKGVAFAWIGSVLGPLFLIAGLGNPKEPVTYIGLAFLLIVAFSIRDGFKAKKHGIISDFIALSVMPILIPIGCILWFAFN